MKKVFIVGGDGFARECHSNLNVMKRDDPSIEFGGFLGHGGYGHTVNYKHLQEFYLGEESDHVFKDDEYAVIGAGYPDLRRKIYNDLKKRDVRFFNLILGKYGSSVTFGEANISVYTSLTVNTKIGNGNVFNGAVIVGHDTEIGDFNFFGPRSSVLGTVKIGNDNIIGTNAVILPHAKIGNNNKVAPLSAVYKGCRHNCYMLGNPALKVGEI